MNLEIDLNYFKIRSSMFKLNTDINYLKEARHDYF